MNNLSAKEKSRHGRVRNRIFLAVRALIILAPLPFGCVGGGWRPLFFFSLALIGIFAWREVEKKAEAPRIPPERVDPARELLYGRHLPVKKKSPGVMIWAARLWAGFILFCVFQLLPLPAAVVKFISPRTLEIATRLRGTPPAWLSLSQVPRETLVFVMEILVLTAFGLALVRMRPGWREMTALIRALGWSAALQVVFGLIRLISGSSNFFLLFAPWKNRTGDLTGTLVNSNHFSFFLELTAPLVLALLVVKFASRAGSVLHRVLEMLEKSPGAVTLLLILVLLAAGVVLSNSRAGLTALLAGVIIAGLMMARTRRAGLQRLLPIFVGSLAVLILFVAGGRTWKSFRNMPLHADEGSGRIQRWPSVMRMIGDFPVAGTGMGTFRWAYFPYDHEANKWVTHAHNDLLETWAEGGGLGALLLLGGFIVFIAALLTRWRRRHNLRVRLLAAGGIASLAAALFHSLFDFSLRIPVNALVLALVMVITWRVVNYRKTRVSNRPLRDGGTW